MTDQLSQHIVEIARYDDSRQVQASQVVLEIAYHDDASSMGVSQHIIEIAFLVSGRIQGPAVQHI